MSEGEGILAQDITLRLSGLGIVFYSPSAALHIPEGADYLCSHYLTPEQVQPHIQAGTIVGFGTSSSGVFTLRFHGGYPDESCLQSYRFRLRLGLRCKGGIVCFRDLYDLIDWDPSCPAEQMIRLADGIYHVTLCSELPASGIIGDDQLIEVYLQPLEAFPRLSTTGIPTLCL